MDNDDIDQPSILQDDELYDDYNYYKNIGNTFVETNKSSEHKDILQPDSKLKDKLKTSINNLKLKEDNTLITSIPIENNKVNKPISNSAYAKPINKKESAQKNTSNKSETQEIAYSKINDFDKILKNELSYKIDQPIKEENEMTNDEDEIDLYTLRKVININDIEKQELYQRYLILQKKYSDSQNQIVELNRSIIEERNKQKDFIDLLKNDSNSELKDKKLIELAKKNSDLNLKIEKFKLKEKEFEKRIKQLELTALPSNQNNKDSNIFCNDMLKDSTDGNIVLNQNNAYLKDKNILVNNEEVINLKKKMKQQETRITELSNKNQQLKSDNSKLESLLKKELGDNYDNITKDKNWKGRAETIEILKGKNRLYEQIINNSNNINSDLIKNLEDNKDDNQAVQLALTNNHIAKLSNNVIPFTQYKKEKEEFKKEIIALSTDKEKLNTENSKLKSRKDVLEKELKNQKESLTSKIKILLEKTDNDEKLIVALNKELEKKTGKSITGEDVQFNLKQEISGLREQLKDKQNQYEKLEQQLIGNTGKSNISLLGLLEKIEYLEQENKELKSFTGEGKIYEALARENASLRLKLYQKEKKLD